MFIKNRPIAVGEAKATEIRAMVGPERFHQASGFQRGSLSFPAESRMDLLANVKTVDT